MSLQLAQINVGRLRYALDDPHLGDFMGNLERINAMAEASAGFVWRLKDDTGNATGIQAYEDPRIIINMSVWATLEALQQFAYRTEHVVFFRRRSEWFEEFGAPNLALWWIEAGRFPTPIDGRRKLEQLGQHGASPDVFTFRERFGDPL